jgi:hypothetical protein
MPNAASDAFDAAAALASAVSYAVCIALSLAWVSLACASSNRLVASPWLEVWRVDVDFENGSASQGIMSTKL